MEKIEYIHRQYITDNMANFQPNWLSYFTTDRLNPEKYREFLQTIIENEKVTFTDEAILNHKTYDKDGELADRFKSDMKNCIEGYCITPECIKNKKHSALLYKYSKHHCLDCLVSEIYRKRNFPIIDVEINFTNPNYDIITRDEYHATELRVHIKESGIYLNDQMIEVNWRECKSNTEANFIIDVISDYYIIINGTKRSLQGSFIGRLFGKFACKNLLMGKACESLINNPLTFKGKLCPPGTCGWGESEIRNRQTHTINIGDFCPACNMKNRSYLNDPEKPTTDKTEIEKIKAENERLKKDWRMISKQNSALLHENDNLKTQIINLTKENKFLLNDNTNMKKEAKDLMALMLEKRFPTLSS